MAAILDVKMAANMAANSTTIPWNFWTAWAILLKFGSYVYYMILYMFYLLGYKNSRWPPSWLPIWPPLKLRNPITFEPPSRFCSNLVDIFIIWSFICSTCWVTKIQDGRYHGCQYGRQSTWWNCVALSVRPPVGKASGLLPEATLSFLASNSEHSVSKLLLSRALSFGTHSHWTLDNLVTI